jgi:FMN phosphatase YigB (HAD superfamily)
VAVAKPGAAFYEAVLATAKCGAHEMIHVGDSIENDVLAAQALRIRAVWLNRDRQQNTKSGAWAEIHSLVELPAIVGC